jgi:hypothetical protein
MTFYRHKFCCGDLTVKRLVSFRNLDGCSFINFYFIFSSWHANFLCFRYRHTRKRNVQHKGTWLHEELEQSPNVWAIELMETNLRS